MNKITSKIRNYARFKPLSQKEAEISINSFLTTTNTQISLDTNSKYTYDGVFSSKTTQEQLFTSLILPMIKDCVSGYNTALITYGGAESGKTYSLMGPTYALYENDSDVHGLIPRFLKYIFDDNKMMDLLNAATIHIGVNFELVEIDGDKTNDLLKGMNVFQKKTSAYTRVEMSNYSNAKTTFLQGFKNRNIKMKETAMIYCFTIDSVFTSKLTEKLSSHQGKILFADLPNCNSKNMSGFNNIVNMLMKKYKYIDYSTSKITSILQPCLNGDYKTIFLSHMSQSVMNITDTLSSLGLSTKIKNLSNEVSQHENLKDALQLMVKENAKISERAKSADDKPDSTAKDAQTKPQVDTLNLLALNDENIKNFFESKKKFDEVTDRLLSQASSDTQSDNDMADKYLKNRAIDEIKQIQTAKSLENNAVEVFNKIDFTQLQETIKELSKENTTEKIKYLIDSVEAPGLNTNIKDEVIKSTESELKNKLDEKNVEIFALKSYITILKSKTDPSIEKSKYISEEMIDKISSKIFAENSEDQKKMTIEFIDNIITSLVDIKEKCAEYEKKIKEDEVILLDKDEEISKLKSDLEQSSSELQISNEKVKGLTQSIEIYNKKILMFKEQVNKIDKEVNFDDVYILLNNINIKTEALFKQYEKDLEKVGNFVNKTSKKIFDLPIIKAATSGRISFIDMKNKEKELTQKKTQIEDLEKKLNLAKADNTKLKGEILKLKNQIVKLEKDIEQFGKDKQKFEKEKKDFETQLVEAEKIKQQILAEKNQEITKMQNELVETNKKKAEVEKKVIEVEENKKKLNEQLEEALVQKLKVQTEKESLNQSLKETNKKLEKAQEEITEIIEEKKKDIAKMESAISELSTEKENILKLKEENERKHNEISKAMLETQRKLEKSKEESEQKLKAELNKLTIAKNNLEEKNSEYQQREKNLNSQLETLEYQCNSLNEEKLQLEKDKYSKMQENMQLSEKVKEILSQLSQLQTEKEATETNLMEAKEKLKKAESDMKDILSEKENELKQLNEKLTLLEKQKQELENKKKETEENCKKLHQKIDDLLQQLKALEEEKAKLDMSKTEEVEDITKRIQGMNELIASLKNELEANREIQKKLEEKSIEFEKQKELFEKEKISLQDQLVEIKKTMEIKETEHQKEIQEFKINSKNLNTTIEKLQTEKQKLTKMKDEIESQAKELNTKLVSLNKEKNKIESEKKYLNTTVSSLLEELDTYKSSDFQDLKIQNDKFRERFKSIFGKHLDIEKFLQNDSNNVCIKWDQTTLSKLTQKIIQLREEKRALSNDIILLQSDLDKTLSGSLADSQLTLLMKIKEENRKLRKEIINIKKRYNQLEQEIKLAYYNALNEEDYKFTHDYYDIVARIVDGEKNEESDGFVVCKGFLQTQSSTNVNQNSNSKSTISSASVKKHNNTLTASGRKRNNATDKKPPETKSKGGKKIKPFTVKK